MTPTAALDIATTDGLQHSQSQPRGVPLILRSEGAAALALSLLGYRFTDASWWLFAALFLVPDLSMLVYLVNTRVGATAYNFGHTYLAPAVVALAGPSPTRRSWYRSP